MYLLEYYLLINYEDVVHYKREHAIIKSTNAYINVFLRRSWKTVFDIAVPISTMQFENSLAIMILDAFTGMRCICSNLNGISSFLWQNLTSISSGWTTVQRRKYRRACFVSDKILDNTCHCQILEFNFQKAISIIRWFQQIISFSRTHGKGPIFSNVSLKNSRMKRSAVGKTGRARTVSEVLWRWIDATAHVPQMIRA